MRFDLADVFIEELGWDRFRLNQAIEIDGRTYTLEGLAAKRGFQVFKVVGDRAGDIPDSATRKRIEREVAKSAYEHLLVFVDGAATTQAWHWARREPGKPLAAREEWFRAGQQGQAIAERLAQLVIDIDEEEQLTLPEVAGRVKGAFDVERVTKRFYDRFKAEHSKFLDFIRGITEQGDREWYASLMLNRLMFVYFIQKRGFLDGDPDYLRNRLSRIRSSRGPNQFLSFYQQFLRRLFHEGLGAQPQARRSDFTELLGSIPYVNGGLFEVHQLEDANPNIDIADEAFEQLFAFFDGYRWHLDERPLRDDNEINPDVLGYIFEKYINQKQMGAYYSKEDITGYIARNTVLPFILDAARKECAIAFHPGAEVWSLLSDDPDRYINAPVRHGVDVPLPEEIAAGASDVSKRGGWNRPADAEFALPTETWREHVARRARCLKLRAKLAAGDVTTADDLITLNLDIAQLTQDAIDNAEGPELARAFWKALQRLTVLDPTCGSGAFLFAALNLLEPLYDACIRRMTSFVDDLDRSEEAHRPEKLSDFREILAELGRHPNRRHFVLKSIILNNLYGVDIMEEAVEICKLRLFLKLVAQIDRAEQVEPLPDIDFNIRAGNTLVGFATYDEVNAAVLGGLQGKMDLDGAMQRIREEAEKADFGFEQFREIQRQTDFDADDLVEAKKLAREGLRALSGELDRYLAREYGIDPANFAAFAKWRSSHQPFHWFAEFYGIMKAGGFDVVIGNPPYFELNVLKDYILKGYACTDAGNIYAVMLERACALRPRQGRLGFIVPVSSISADRYESLHALLAGYRSHVSSFDDRPSRLFEGIEHARLAIHLLGPAAKGVGWTTRYSKWNAVERPTLFPLLQYQARLPSLVEDSVPKISADLEASIVERIGTQKRRLAFFYDRLSSSHIFYSRKVGYFLQVVDFQPRVLDGRGRLRPPSEFKELRFENSQLAHVALAALNSSLFFWFVTVFSDCRHLNKREVDLFPIDLAEVSASNRAELATLSQSLMDRLQTTSVDRRMKFGHDELTVQCLFPRTAKDVIDEIDGVLADHYGFTEEELDFVRNYEAKYRMRSDTDSDLG